MNHSKFHDILPILLAVLFLAFPARAAYGAEVIYQSGLAMPYYQTAGYQLINNPNLAMSYGYSYFNGTSFSSTSGPETEFQSLIYTGIGNPQSMAVSPDGTTAWVMSTDRSGSDNARHGRIYRVDLTKYLDADASADSDSGAVTAGPEIVTGHGQTLSYNPANGELWFVRETKVQNTTLVQVDPDSLEVVKEIHFRFSDRIVFPPTFCFDREGNCWTYTRSAGSTWAPAGSIRFYKGRIEDDYVSFEMVPQGLRYPPGYLCQAFGYNPYNDRLYVVSDGEYITVPAGSLGAASAEEVETTVFGNQRREFEGIGFSEDGTCFLLTNKPSEIMRDRVSFEAGKKERARIAKVKEQYRSDRKAMDQKEASAKEEIVAEKVGELIGKGF